MCLIALMPPGTKLEEWEIKSAFQRNDDGFGIMMPMGDGTIKVQKILPKTVDPVIELYNKFLSSDIAKTHHHAVHFRFKTHGQTDLANAHPFRVLRKEKHGIDLYMMHNGVISSNSLPKSDPNKSDTWHFIHHLLRPTLKYNPKLIYDPKFQKMIEMAIGFGSKLTFMDHEGTPIIINKTGGMERSDGIWLSNSSAIQRPSVNTHRQGGWSGADYSRHWSERFSNSRQASSSSNSSGPNVTKEKQTEIPFDPSTSPLIASLGGPGPDSCPIPDPLEGKYYDKDGKWVPDAWKRDCDSFFLAFETGGLRSPSGDQQNATTNSSEKSSSGDQQPPNLNSGGDTPTEGATTCELQSADGTVRSSGAVTCKLNPGTPIADCEKDCDCAATIEKSKSLSVMAGGENGGSQMARIPFSSDDSTNIRLSQFISNYDPTSEQPSITTELLCELNEEEILDLIMSFPEAMSKYVMEMLAFFDELTLGRMREAAIRGFRG